jgi:NTE family protein
VKIGEDWYWDGGLVSNTPLQYVLDHREPCELTVFQVDLFSSRGVVPRTMADVLQREKDIRYSSRTRLNTDLSKKLQSLRVAARRLAKRLPAELCDDPDLQVLLNHDPEGSVAIMHLINRCTHYESNSKDYEFSRHTIEEHWSNGHEDAAFSLAHPEWIARSHAGDGITTYDLAGDRPRRTGASGTSLESC